MSWLDGLGFDRYERRARLYPGLLASIPIVLAAIVLRPDLTLGANGKTALGLATYAGVFYFLVNVARAAGKKVELKLLARWGGWPTTILLRHRDLNIDPITKARYHLKLSELAGVSLPTEESEKAEPEKADDTYRSVTKKLLESRRGPKFQLLSDDNSEYGFRRNMLGLRPWACSVIAVSVALVIVICWWPVHDNAITAPSLFKDLGLRWSYYAFCAACLMDVLIWTLYVSEAWVRQAAFTYALSLLRTLDEPENERSLRTRSRGRKPADRPN